MQKGSVMFLMWCRSFILYNWNNKFLSGHLFFGISKMQNLSVKWHSPLHYSLTSSWQSKHALFNKLHKKCVSATESLLQRPDDKASATQDTEACNCCVTGFLCQAWKKLGENIEEKVTLWWRSFGKIQLLKSCPEFWGDGLSFSRLSASQNLYHTLSKRTHIMLISRFIFSFRMSTRQCLHALM